jgi:threonine aldolase
MPIDLRSDTVTTPTPSMREAMAEAEVGDDVYREDRLVRQLEERAAQLLGKESGLLLPSGTMGNLVAVMACCQRGDEIIMEDQMHMFWYEVAGIAALAGVQIRTVSGLKGVITPQQVEEAIRGEDIHFPRTRMLCLENTHNRAGGICLSKEQMDQLCGVARQAGLWVHVDGARIFNAAASLGCKPSDLVSGADSVMFCLSKGLAAPVGSLLVGSHDFIERSRKCRKMLGGGMRQAGVLAAAGLVSLSEMLSRLPEDHETARALALGLASLGAGIDMESVQTNIVRYRVPVPAADFAAQLAQKGILAGVTGPDSIRMVTHYQVSPGDIDAVLAAVSEIL